MKKMTMIVAMLVLGLTSVFALTTAGGNAEVKLDPILDLAVGDFVTDGSAEVILEGVAVVDLTVASGIVINDNSGGGWNLQIAGTNLLTNGIHTIAYTMDMANVVAPAALGAGLTLTAASPLVLGTDAITATGTATTSTEDYTFDLVIDITADACLRKVAGTYVDALTLTLTVD